MEPRFETTLSDGTRVAFRPIRPDDKQRLVDGFERLSPESRYRRFFAQIDHLSGAQLEYLTEIDGESHCAWIAVLPEEPGEPGIGVGRWVRLADEPDVAEAAVTVIDDYQGRGVGKMLLLLTARTAVEKRIRAIRAWVQADNEAMLHLLAMLGAQLGRVEGGLREVNVPLPSDPSRLPQVQTSVLRATASGEIPVIADRRGSGVRVRKP